MKSQQKNIFDRNLLKTHRDRAAAVIENHDFLLQSSAEEILDHAISLGLRPKAILDLGSRNGILSDKLAKQYKDANLIATDISSNMLLKNKAKNKIILDEEKIADATCLLFKENKFNLITSLLNIHWINDLPSFFKSIKNLLDKDGVFIASFFVSPSLKNLRNILLKSEIDTQSKNSPHISPFVEAKDSYHLLQYAGFDFIIVDCRTIEVEYDNVISLMRELQKMGESSNLILGEKILPRKMHYFLTQCDKKFIDNIEIVTLIAKVT